MTKKPYRGINVLLTGIEASMQGYADTRWLTYRQAQAKGGQVRRGEKGLSIIFWKMLKKEDFETGELSAVPLLRYYTVFNVEQCDWEKPLEVESKPTEHHPHHMAEAIQKGYVAGPEVKYGGGSAFYQHIPDSVHLPTKESFNTSEGYYATLFHELCHSTGHPSRLNREGFSTSVKFGSAVYSREELVAEMGAAFLMGEAGLASATEANSASYIDGWLGKFKGDKRLVITAAGAGQKAADRILGRVFDNDD